MISIYDHSRIQRIGMPEAVFCEGKSKQDLNLLLLELATNSDNPVLLTRLDESQVNCLEPKIATALDYDVVSQTGYLHGRMPIVSGSVSVVTAGTSDRRVACEAERTLQFLGVEAHMYYDLGVAGLWRIMERLEDIVRADIIIVVAGMDAALASVLAGLVAQPIIGVPTSAGYGICNGGKSALHAMLASCAQGLVVMNIDNGFGAACAAMRVLRGLIKAET